MYLKLIVYCIIGLLPTVSWSSQKLVVTATTTFVRDIVQDIGGDEITLLSLMGSGTDPHLYKPTAQDTSKLRLAKVIFYNGLHLEGKITSLLEAMPKHGKIVQAVTANIDQEKLIKLEGSYDPHVWFDIVLWMECIDTVTDTLAQADAKNEVIYRRRAEDLKKRYYNLHQWVLETVGQLPREKRLLITSHDAYHYFGKAYGFEVVGVQGISTITEAGLADVTRVVDLVRQRKVRAIFVESSVSPATIERISKDSGAIVGGELFSDALGIGRQVFVDPVTKESYPLDTYEGVIRYNVHTIVQALL